MGKEETAEFYKFDFGNLPDELYFNETPVEEWLKRCETTSSKNGFPSKTTNSIAPISSHVGYERLCGIAIYMFGNVFPFMILPLSVAFFFGGFVGKCVVGFVACYVSVLGGLERFYFMPYFLKKYKQKKFIHKGEINKTQYCYTERNNGKYCSVKFIWPKSLHPTNNKDMTDGPPMIFCIVPHGVAPLGITSYPLYSKFFNSKLCRWTAAPIVLKLPLVGLFTRSIGYIPAKTKAIMDTISKKEQNVGITLDGIAGMFHQSSKEEIAYLKKRKGVVKIALRLGCPIVPVYGFGHTSLWTVFTDPFGILENLSNKLGASLTPFFGRYMWFLGPPHRVPLTVCFGNPIHCPKSDEPTQKQIDDYHQQMLNEFKNVFNTHKDSYGWSKKNLKFV